MLEAKPYFSGKQKPHRFKTEALVLPNRICISLSGHTKGGEADISNFRRRLPRHKFRKKKKVGKLDLSDKDDGSENHSAVIFDKEF